MKLQLPRVVRTHSTIVGLSLLFLVGISGLLLSLSPSVEEVILYGEFSGENVRELAPENTEESSGDISKDVPEESPEKSEALEDDVDQGELEENVDETDNAMDEEKEVVFLPIKGEESRNTTEGEEELGMEEEPTEDVIKDESIDENQVIDEKIEFEDNEVNISSVMINDNIEVFTGDTTWIVPNGITEVEVFAVGGGGGGAGDGCSAHSAGGGGDGGQISIGTVNVIPNQAIQITIGKGGNGGLQMRCYVSAEDGGDTMFGNFITALGGIGGRQSDTRQSMHEANKPHHLNSAKGGKGMGYEGYNGQELDGENGTVCSFCEDNNKYGAGGAGGSDSYGGFQIGGTGGDTGGGNGGGGPDNVAANRGNNAIFYGAGGGGAAFSSNHTYSQGGNGYQGIIIIKYDTMYSISYTPTEQTTGSVIATVTALKSGNFTFTTSGWETIDGGTTYIKTYTDNITGELVSFETSSGNVEEKLINITNIIPEVTLTYTPEGPTLTTGSVTAKVSFNKSGITITNNGGSPEYTFTERGEFVFEWRDDYGNTRNATASVDWIGDGIPIIPTITYTPNGPSQTVGNVIALISFNKSGVVLTNNSGNTYTFTENGEFIFTFKDTYGITGSATARVNWILHRDNDFDYQSGCETYIIPTDGVYKLQVWGAQGGYSGNPKGSGGYAEGNIALHKDELLYVCVGGQPTDCNVGGYNGGGPSYQSSTNDSCGGGGGTDIRIGTNSLYARVIVAGGGGAGYSNTGKGNYAGRENSSYDGTQIGSSICNTSYSFMNGSFGVGGGNPVGNPASIGDDYGGGGGGRYGGSSCGDTNGGGGSNYVLTEHSYKPIGYLLDATYYLTDARIVAGNASMPNPAGGSMVGNAGDGYAKITLLSPIGTITYTPSTLTNQEVRAILTLNMSGSISSGENRIATGTTGREFFKVFSENMTGEIVEFIGENGYTGSAFITIDRIDKQPPRIINLTYTPKEETTAPVLVTIVFDEFTILSGWEKINDVTFTKIYTENKEEQIVFSDIVGNTNEIRIHISQIVSPSLDGGGGGGVSLKKDYCPDGDFSPSYYDNKCEITFTDDSEHPTANEIEKKSDFQSAYEWAYVNKITTIPTFEQARIADTITRAEMAKMIVAFATIDAVLVAFPPEKGEEPSVPEGSGGLSTVDEMEENLSTTERGQCHSFSDLNQATPDLQSSIIQACQLGLMGLKADGKTVKSAFSPNATITTAEIATTISRLLRGNAYQGSEKWRYHNHLLTLQKADIIPRNIDPMRKELRGTVFQMLMNTVKLFHTTNT